MTFLPSKEHDKAAVDQPKTVIQVAAETGEAVIEAATMVEAVETLMAETLSLAVVVAVAPETMAAAAAAAVVASIKAG